MNALSVQRMVVLEPTKVDQRSNHCLFLLSRHGDAQKYTTPPNVLAAIANRPWHPYVSLHTCNAGLVNVHAIKVLINALNAAYRLRCAHNQPNSKLRVRAA